MNAVLETLYERLDPVRQKAMVEFLADHPWEILSTQQHSALVEHRLKAVEVYTEHLLDSNENQAERAAIMEYDAYCPRWQAEDRALGRCQCPMDSPEAAQAERARPLGCEYACEV